MIDPRHDGRFMAAALALGRKGLGRTMPNPSVGAVLVRQGERGPLVVGIGRTADGGRPHAERVALQMACEAARGATLYVTLEPCSHFGRTSPCADAVIAAGVAAVVVASADPNPQVSGEGLAKLRAAGISVRFGVRQREAERDLAGHRLRMTLQRPFVTLKLALDETGAIGVRGQGMVPISGAQSNRRTQVMRAQADAIAVGIGTVLADDPRLTCRLPGMAARSPMRVVFDTAARTPPGAALLSGPGPAPLIFTSAAAREEARAALRQRGASVAVVDSAEKGLDVAAALGALCERGVGWLVLEGGAALAQAFAAADLIDEAVLIEAPVRLEGEAVRPFGGDARGVLGARLCHTRTELVGGDRWLHLRR